MSATTRSQRVTATLVLVAACLFFGAAIGQMAVSLFSEKPASGLDGPVDSSGALLIGGLLGGIAGAYLARDLSVTARWWSAAIALVLAIGTLWSLALTV